MRLVQNQIPICVYNAFDPMCVVISIIIKADGSNTGKFEPKRNKRTKTEKNSLVILQLMFKKS